MIWPVNKEFLQEVLDIQDDPNFLIFYEDTLSDKMRELSSESHVTFINTLFPPNVDPSASLSHYKLNILSEPTKANIAMVNQVLGYNYDLGVDDIVLGFLLMSILISHESLVKLDIIVFFMKW